jgi:voltage-gated potassium channel
MSNGQIREVATKLSHSGRFRKIVGGLVVAVVALGLLMPIVERGGEQVRIKSEWDGVYFAVTTVTGVGYGDMVPVTQAGRVVTMLLEVFGVVLFGSIMAFVSVELLRYQEDFNMRRLLERMDEQDKKTEELKKRLDYLVRK